MQFSGTKTIDSLQRCFTGQHFADNRQHSPLSAYGMNYSKESQLFDDHALVRLTDW